MLSGKKRKHAKIRNEFSDEQTIQKKKVNNTPRK